MPNVFNVGNVVKQLIWTRVMAPRVGSVSRKNRAKPNASTTLSESVIFKALRFLTHGSRSNLRQCSLRSSLLPWLARQYQVQSANSVSTTLRLKRPPHDPNSRQYSR